MRKSSLVLAASALLFLSASAAQADLVLVIDDPSTAGLDVIIIDNVFVVGVSSSGGFISTTADQSGMSGQVMWSGSIGIFDQTQIAIGTSKPVLGNSEQARLSLVDISISSSGSAAGSLAIGVTDTDYSLSSGNPIEGFSWVLTGTTDGTVDGRAGYDINNGEFFVSHDLTSPTLSGPFLYTDGMAIPLVSPFSLSQRIDIFHPGGATSPLFTSFTSVITVPEPASACLLLVGFAGVGIARRKRRSA